MKVSVIIPIYKVEAYIERCARSLFEQTLKDVEYIFVNDCTPDRSVEVLKNVIEEYPDRKSQIRILHHEKNRGLTTTRNTGLGVATGEFIAHCDSDDWVAPTMYEMLYQKAVEDEADVVYCDIKMVFRDKDVIARSAQYDKHKFTFVQNYIASTWTCLVLVMARKRLYDYYQLKSPNHISYCEDFWLTTRLMHYAAKIVYVPQAFYNYNCTNEQSIVHTLNKQTEKEEQVAYLETIDFFEKERVISYYQKQMGWRILKSKQELILDPDRHKEFMNIYPLSHKYIGNCPYINTKLKIMMWCLTHHLSWITYAMIYVRNFKENYIRR